MIFKGTIYIVYVDGIFAGITDDETMIGNVAEDFTNGDRKPLSDDDMADRVFWDAINVNRWYFYDEYNCCDKLSDDSIFCRGHHATHKCVDKMNELTLEKERAEAKLRALQL